jgi:hypothetical protein
MKLYSILVNGNVHYARASRAAVALARVAQKFTESELQRANFILLSSRKLEYEYHYVADVPCEPAGSTKRELLVSPSFTTEKAAYAGLANFHAAYPEYKFVAIRGVEKP